MSGRNGSANAYYGVRHRELRRQFAAQVATGRVRCARCQEFILPGERWDLGHRDGGGPNEYHGPEHQSCNRATSTHALERGRRVDLRDYEDDPDRKLFFGPPGLDGIPLKWSRPWTDWRSGPLTA